MAVPQVSDNPVVQQQYAAQLAVSAALFGALRQLWATINPPSSPRALARYREGVVVLATRFAAVSASIATDFYRDARAEAGFDGAVTIKPVPGPPRSQVDAALDWALRDIGAEVDAKARALMAEVEQQTAEWLRRQAAAQARVESATQKLVADTGRSQVVAAVAGDEKAIGYRRVPRPDACAWCIVLAVRTSTRKGLAKDFKKYGPGTLGSERHYGVYKSRASAGQITPSAEGDTNRFHKKCHCVVEPVFDTLNVLPVWLHDLETLYEDTAGDLNDFRRALKAQRGGLEPPPPNVPVPAPAVPNKERIDALLDLLAQVA